VQVPRGSGTLLQKVILALIEQMPVGTLFRVQNLYQKARNVFLLHGKGLDDECAILLEQVKQAANRGDLPNEPRYKNDVRWTIRCAKDIGLVKHHSTPKSGEWRRV
jgi:hypothetical protein